MPDEAAAAAFLCSAAAVRERCTGLLAVAETDGLKHFSVHADRLGAAADFTAAVIRRNYPSLAIPHHARWRHFAADGVDRWGRLRDALAIRDAFELARSRVELCVVSVLLDAGAGAAWRYREPATGRELARSEGLGVASLDAFRAGLFAADGSPRVDAAALAALPAEALGAAFQAGPDNELAGLEGRAALLRRLGEAVGRHPGLFRGGRLGGLFDAMLAAGQPVRAATILSVLLDGLGEVWPSRIVLAGRPLGDVWPHPAAPGDGLVPFHKLSQWLAYSLIEVFEEAEVAVAGISDLTGLPEYRNGGLLLDTGVLRGTRPKPHRPAARGRR